ncbi:MAG: DMT family transporter [Pseudomonadota bacterium]
MNTTPVNNLRGIACLITAGLFLVTTDAITKWLIPHYPTGQILFVQGGLISFIAIICMQARGESPWGAADWRPHLYRGGLYIIGAFAFLIALRYLPFAEVVAIAFAGPMFMTLLGRFFLGESVGWHRLSAVIAGFVGVLFVMQPTGEGLHWAALLPLIVAMSDALRDLVTRQMAGTESNLRIVFSTAAILVIGGLLTAAGGWNTLRTEDIIWFVLSACTFVIAHFIMVEAYRYGQLSAVAPFRYIQIIWAILAGWVIWGEVPTNAVAIGIAIICCSGVYIAWREALARSESQPPSN